MAIRALTLLMTLLVFLSGCGTDTKTTENLGASVGQAHYGGLFIDGNENPANRAQYLGYSLKGTVNIGGTGNTTGTPPVTSPPPAYTTVDYTISCLSCHPNGDNNANAAILKDYARSGHADVADIPWTIPEIGATCQRCHTTFGFRYHLETYAPVNYNPLTLYRGITLSSPDYNPQWTPLPILSTPLNQREEYRKAMQVLICSACHPETGLVTGALRVPFTPGGFVAIWSENNIVARVDFPEAGASNLCIRCHSSRYAGPNITSLATATAHYLPVAATVYSGTVDLVNIIDNTTSPLTPPLEGSKFTGVAYEFAGQSYVTPAPSHKNVGTPGGKGPCVGCHMSGASGHALKVVAETSAGEITAINSDACLGCHGVLLPAWINGKKEGFSAAVAELDTLLQGRGFYFNPADGLYYKDAAFTLPIGGTGTRAQIAATTNAYYDAQASALLLNPAHLRGVAFNLWLFRASVGDRAAYVHNSNYTKKILFDSIDYLNDDTFPGGVTLVNPLAAAYLDGDSVSAGIQRP